MGVPALLVATPAAADPVARWQPLIEAASARCGVPSLWIAEVMRAESGGRTELNGRPIVSRAGAMGLMQLMPGTWTEMRALLRLGVDPHAPRDNILAGACYLRRLYERFGHPGLFAAYNAGPARYAAHLARGKRLPAETRAYLTGPARAGSGHPAAQEKPLAVTQGLPRLFFALRRDTPAAKWPTGEIEPFGAFYALTRAGPRCARPALRRMIAIEACPRPQPDPLRR